MNEIFEGLRYPSAYPHETNGIEIVETHISLLFLTGRYAYKIKKNLDLGFLDFSTPEKREYYCREELRLNRRLCPELYLDVVPVTKDSAGLRIAGSGKIVDHAVKMVQFDRSKELDALLSRNLLREEEADQIAAAVAAFHLSLPAVADDTPFGRPEAVIKPVLDNFAAAARLNMDHEEAEELAALKSWSEAEHRRLLPIFSSRKASGRIRQCHGDMHTGNMVLWNGRVTIFDCIEFNPFLSTIDVISDIAFLVMDLEHRSHPGYAWRFLNDYLSLTGDYEGLPLLRFYKTYRAMVRVKVTAIRLLQETREEEKSTTLEEHQAYLALARSFGVARPHGLVITCGVSGSGKTTLARGMAEKLQAIHIRSDIERKRIFGIDRLEKTGGERKRALYSVETTQRTYAKMRSVASRCLDESYTVITDATFLRKEERLKFVELAEQRGLPVVILCCDAPQDILEHRVNSRHNEGADASDADRSVLVSQQKNRETLSGKELNIAIFVDTSVPESAEEAMLNVSKRISAGE
ncbi:hypothetical protein CHL67_06670 [Prosthecochloris sp. GSB1]|uniref:bifunctional aminoglycoside phosphotransferase/ATP-binding protein n=1 Tax=Prosthecochloris sp. GSB1 TaxID=281093 RepID=UPI000B8CCBBE|nr:bifunctional aminoglycoside phosphotransferase/ATP-binding protein [Prosthecochloris sp. GSB1]ASQ90651.1 hypothetical protein CHL67_06670 [Prosthecochloris sp. GSB1]